MSLVLARPSRSVVAWRRFAATAVLAAAFAAAVPSGCRQAPKEDPAALRAAIDAANRRFMEAFARKDGAAIGLLYTEDARAYPPGAPVVEGRSAIEAMWKSVLALPISEARLETVDLSGAGETAWETGRYRLVAADSTVTEYGKYVVIWKRIEGSWKMHHDIWNSDTPAGAPATDGPGGAPPARG